MTFLTRESAQTGASVHVHMLLHPGASGCFLEKTEDAIEPKDPEKQMFHSVWQRGFFTGWALVLR